MRLHVAPLEGHAPSHFVVGQDSALHPVVDGAQFLLESAGDLGLADVTFRFVAGGSWLRIFSLVRHNDSAVEQFKRRFLKHVGNAAFTFFSGPGASGLVPGNFDFLCADLFRELKLSQPLEHSRSSQSFVRCHVVAFRSLLWRTIRHSQRMGGQIESVRGQIVSGQKNPREDFPRGLKQLLLVTSSFPFDTRWRLIRELPWATNCALPSFAASDAHRRPPEIRFQMLRKRWQRSFRLP